MTRTPYALTRRQRTALEAIRSYIQLHGYPPTRRELSVTLGVSPQAAHHLVIRLEAQGYLRRMGSARAITMLAPDDVSGPHP